VTTNSEDSGVNRATEDAFATLGDETRLRILIELGRAVREGGQGSGLSFSDLRERVGVSDSGRFNYHLDKLEGRFVTKTDDGDYAARYSALAVVSAFYAGAYAPKRTEQTAETDRTCLDCDRSLEMRYADQNFELNCPEHGARLSFPAPTGAIEPRTLDELSEVVIARAMSNMNLVRQGICPRCWGTTTVDYPHDIENVDEPAVGVSIACDRCWLQYETLLRVVASSHPAVRGLYQEQGYELYDAFFSERFMYSTYQVQVDETEPMRATVTVELDGTRLRMELDGDGTVLELTRE
jgi:DNA-binding transcriptional ArsR family regulator